MFLVYCGCFVQISCLKQKLTHVSDAPHAHESGVAEALVPEASVLSRPHVHHSASEVGLLIHEPVAIHNIAGLAVRQ